MPTLGSILTTLDIGISAIRAGKAVIPNAHPTQLVAFSTPMPSADYIILIGSDVTTAIVTAKTANGFTVKLPGGGTVGWVAVDIV